MVDNGFANNLMQALSTTTLREGYSPTLRVAIEERLARLLDDCLPNLGHVSSREIANIVFMAFDGYSLNFHLSGKATSPTRAADSIRRHTAQLRGNRCDPISGQGAAPTN